MKWFMLVGLAAYFLLVAWPAHAQSKMCRYYQHHDGKGASHTIEANTEQAFVGTDWNDKISSYRLSRGCELHAFKHSDFKGASIIFQLRGRNVPPEWNDQISSTKCVCQ